MRYINLRLKIGNDIDLLYYIGDFCCLVQAILDADCQKSLREMTEQLLPQTSVVAEFSVLWRNDEGISAYHHRDYLDELAWTVGTWLQTVVDETVAKWGDTWSQADTVLDELVGEIRQHWLSVRDRVKWFTGRKDVVNVVQSYVVSDDDKPLVLHGPPGIGKSSVMAKVAAEVLADFIFH